MVLSKTWQPKQTKENRMKVHRMNICNRKTPRRALMVMALITGMGGLSQALPLHSIEEREQAQSQTPTPTPTVSHAVEAPGYVFYKLPSGELVKRETTLVVPARGQGDVVLRSETRTTTASRFWTETSAGKTTFHVQFNNPPGAPENTVLLFKGTYLRGTNKALYYGDVYKKSGAETSQDDHHRHGRHHRRHKDFTYAGGFFFKTAAVE